MEKEGARELNLGEKRKRAVTCLVARGEVGARWGRGGGGDRVKRRSSSEPDLPPASWLV